MNSINGSYGKNKNKRKNTPIMNEKGLMDVLHKKDDCSSDEYDSEGDILKPNKKNKG